jgi:hypothetical protein
MWVATKQSPCPPTDPMCDGRVTELPCDPALTYADELKDGWFVAGGLEQCLTCAS